MKKFLKGKNYAFVELSAEEVNTLQQAHAILKELGEYIADNNFEVGASEEIAELIDDIYWTCEHVYLLG